MKTFVAILLVAAMPLACLAVLTADPTYGYTVTLAASGIPSIVFGMVWRPDGVMLVCSSQGLRQVPVFGGPAYPMLFQYGPCTGLTKDLDGMYWAAQDVYQQVYRFNPVTGERTKLITNIGATHDLRVDPISGDLFISDPNDFGPSNGLTRISNQNGANPIITQNYGDAGAKKVDGFFITSDGTFYMAGFNNDDRIHIMPPTNSPNAEVSTIMHPYVIVEQPDGIAVSPNPNGGTPYVFVNTNAGKVLRFKYDAPQEMVVIASGGDRGDFSAVGPDGCLYVTGITSVHKITGPNGQCTFDTGTSTEPAPETGPCVACQNTLLTHACAHSPGAAGCP